ncbi:MAG: hypothetical protein Q9209_003404 [Squamulea sp. 1 TL-2023]
MSSQRNELARYGISQKLISEASNETLIRQRSAAEQALTMKSNGRVLKIAGRVRCTGCAKDAGGWRGSRPITDNRLAAQAFSSQLVRWFPMRGIRNIFKTGASL